MQKEDYAAFAELRRQEIVKQIRENGKVSVAELAGLFSVSTVTVRKDLAQLEAMGELRRTHGGAIALRGDGVVFEPTSRQKESKNVENKRAIAREALKYINEGDVIALDTGTTTRELAKLLVKKPGITVITNDLKAAEILEENKECVIIVLGGSLRHNFNCTIGKNVLDTLRTYHADKAFMATNGISVERGFSTPSIEVAEVKQKMIEASGFVVMLADSSKVGCESFITFADPGDIDLLITDQGLDGEYAKRLYALPIEVAQAS